jgi:hypothetical protein
MATFSLTFTQGFGSHNSGVVGPNAQMPNVQIDDANATVGTQKAQMAKNGQINALIGGVTTKCTIDASRSDPSKGLIFLLPV